MIRRNVLILIAVFLLSPGFSLGQEGKTDDKAVDTALKTKAYDLLDSLATQISTLQSAENRARMGSNIAASIWTHDEKRARALFVTVGQDIRIGLEPPKRKDFQEMQAFLVFHQLRTDTIDRIAKYDPEFAFDFLKTTQPSYEEMPEAALDKERALTLRLAKRVAANNPDIALKLGRAALALGPSEELLTLLRPLLRKHREQGVILHKEIVGKLRHLELTDDYRLINYVRALARIAPPLADETVFQEFKKILITASAENKCDKDRSEESEPGLFCIEIRSLIDQLKEPDRESDEQQWFEVFSELEELVEAGNLDGLIRLGDKHPSIKNQVYWRAFELARNTGDLERAQKIAAASDWDADVKKSMLNQVEDLKESGKLTEAELEQLQRNVEAISDPRHQADLLVAAAVRVGGKNRAIALKLLDRAVEILEAQKPGSVRTGGLVSLAMLYCMEKSDRGFTMMESLMPKLNELIDAAVKLDDFDTHYMRDNEWNMSANGNLGELLNRLSQNAGYFAWCDFDRAVSLAAQFERPEIRMMAQLKLAQAIVAGAPKRLQFATREY